MSSEERRHEPEPREHREEGLEVESETVEEAQGSPEDPGSVDDVDVSGDAAAEEPGPEADTGDETADEAGKTAPVAGELEAVRRERDEYLEALRRLKAEFENARKRQERELARVREMASEKLVTELLPVLDNLDRALESEGDIREGVHATREHFARVLGDEGLAPVASDGQHFDPSVHEAVMSQPSEEHEEGVILQTFERGYLLNGKPIRPAKVVVAHQV